MLRMKKLQLKNVMSIAVLLFMAIAFVPCKLQAQVAVGDILCSDGQILTTSTYPSSGATAIGVVFYVDGTGQHGWAVALQDAGSFIWGPGNNNSGHDTPLVNYTNKRQAIYDLDGYQNTQVVRPLYNGNIYQAFHALDFDNGWYLPALGQLNYLYGNLMEVNEGLATAGGTLFSGQYWSSTEYGEKTAWTLDGTGELVAKLYYRFYNYNPHTYPCNVRGVINF